MMAMTTEAGEMLLVAAGGLAAGIGGMAVWAFLDLRGWVKKISQKQNDECKMAHDWRVLLKTQQDLLIDHINGLPCVKDERLRPVPKLAMPDNGGIAEGAG